MIASRHIWHGQLEVLLPPPTPSPSSSPSQGTLNFSCTVSTINWRRLAKRWTSGQLSNIKCERLLLGKKATPNMIVRPKIRNDRWLSNSMGNGRMQIACDSKCTGMQMRDTYYDIQIDNTITQFICFENAKTWALFNGNVYQKATKILIATEHGDQAAK